MSKKRTLLLLTVVILTGVMTSSLAQEQRLTTGVTIKEKSNTGGLIVSNSPRSDLKALSEPGYEPTT